MKEPSNSTPDNQSLADSVFARLLKSILEGQLAGGTIVQERRLADQMGVSRSPMRDALGRLEGQGLLVRNSRGILTVRVVTLEDYLNCLNLRLLIEPTAAALAAERMSAADLKRLDSLLSDIENTSDVEADVLWDFDDILHQTIGESSGNPFIFKTIIEMRRYTAIFERHQLSGRGKPGSADHRMIVNALAVHDAAGAKEAMHRHLHEIRQKIIENF
ncbi:GntR family transcriptional regulator [Thalassospira sp. TSL5-1]|uniref:GntR family transcriptional regulator n=1 Tax=Thalassospira sp. TSL5-1 TaxID=1544451 RepID=UPI000939D087|nr:GntR family transcriptional regulator [Thalassospira sp. TSL5-1]OKH88038.1 GntR family transcriptional regulator [Thalassospira sp. TSL5-1]